MSNWHDMTPEQRAAQLENDYLMYGFSAFNVSTGERVDPSKIKPIMEEHNIMDEPEFSPSDFFKYIRQSASVKAGAIMFGQAQIAYYDTLKQGMSEAEAFQLLASTTETVVKGVFSTVGPLATVALKAAAMLEYFESMKPTTEEKKAPGE